MQEQVNELEKTLDQLTYNRYRKAQSKAVTNLADRVQGLQERVFAIAQDVDLILSSQTTSNESECSSYDHWQTRTIFPTPQIDSAR